MRRRGAGLWAVGLAAVLVAASVATSQDAAAPHYWPHRTFYIPVNVERIGQSDPKPTHLQLYSSLNRGKWQAGAKLPITGLQNLGDGKKGFQFTADRDGEYEFSVQYHYGDGTSSPRQGDELAAMLSVVIDTTPPVVRITAGSNGVQWDARDDNLDPRKVELQAKFPNWSEWKSVGDRAFKSADAYNWKLSPGQVLEVRVKAFDRAGNEGYSPVVRVPGDGSGGTTPAAAPGGSDWPPGGRTSLPRDPLREPGPGGAGGGGSLPAPRIVYVNNPDITVDYTIQRAGRSGIQAAHLYVLKEQGAWEFAKRFPISPPADTGKVLSLGYRAENNGGTYGFFVAPESGAGVKADPPRKDDPPMLFVVVDTSDPYVKITGVNVRPGGTRGPLVDIAWETADQNLMPDPISLEYSVDKGAAQWNEIKYRLPPGTQRPDAVGTNRYVGQYTWEVPDEKLWKFHVRIRSVDKAANSKTDVWKDEVIVDLEKPAAGITGVRGGTGPAAPGAGSTLPPSPVVRPMPRVQPEPATPPVTPEPATPPARVTPPVPGPPPASPGPPASSGSPVSPPPLPDLPPGP